MIPITAMMKLPEPDIEFVTERVVVLQKPWEIKTRIGTLQCIPGAKSDGASIPECFWWMPGFAPFEGDTLPGAFAHDQLYQAELFDRATADQILFDLLLANGVRKVRADVYYYMVRWFGWMPWTCHTQASIDRCRKYAKII